MPLGDSQAGVDAPWSSEARTITAAPLAGRPRRVATDGRTCGELARMFVSSLYAADP